MIKLIFLLVGYEYDKLEKWRKEVERKYDECQ